MAEEAEGARAPLARLQIRQNAPGQPVWTLTVHTDSLEFDPGGGTLPTVLERPEISGRLELHSGLILRRALAVQLEPGSDESTVFVLEPAAFEQLDAWLGPPSRADLRRALQRRLGIAWTLPVGFLFVYAGLVQGANPAQGVGTTGLEAQRVVLGLLLIVLGGLSRFSPRRWLFLLYALWFSAFAADRILDALGGRGLLLQIPLAGAGTLLAMGGLRQFYRFAVLAPEPSSRAAS